MRTCLFPCLPLAPMAGKASVFRKSSGVTKDCNTHQRTKSQTKPESGKAPDSAPSDHCLTTSDAPSKSLPTKHPHTPRFLWFSWSPGEKRRVLGFIISKEGRQDTRQRTWCSGNQNCSLAGYNHQHLTITYQKCLFCPGCKKTFTLKQVALLWLQRHLHISAAHRHKSHQSELAEV